jgi:hypothetical protein
MEDDDDTGGRVPLWGIIGALIVTLAGALYMLPDVVRDLGPYYMAGIYAHVMGGLLARALLLTLAIWTVFFAVALRGRGRPGTGTMFYALFFVLIMAIDFGGLAAISARGSLARIVASAIGVSPPAPVIGPSTPEDQAAADLQTALSDSSVAMGSLVSPHGGVVMIHEGNDAVSNAFARATRKFVDDVRVAHDAENQQMAALDFPDFLTPTRLSSDRGFARAHARLKTLGGIKAQTGQALDAASASYRSWIAGAAMDPAVKQQALANLDRDVTQEKEFRARDIANTAIIAGACEALLRGLAHPQEPWMVRGGSFLFTTDVDLSAYRRHTAAINAALEKARRLDEGR